MLPPCMTHHCLHLLARDRPRIWKRLESYMRIDSRLYDEYVALTRVDTRGLVAVLSHTFDLVCQIRVLTCVIYTPGLVAVLSYLLNLCKTQ